MAVAHTIRLLGPDPPGDTLLVLSVNILAGLLLTVVTAISVGIALTRWLL